jgi:hypothetical protein
MKKKEEIVEDEIILDRDDVIWMSKVLRLPYEFVISVVRTAKAVSGLSKALKKD